MSETNGFSLIFRFFDYILTRTHLSHCLRQSREGFACYLIFYDVPILTLPVFSLIPQSEAKHIVSKQSEAKPAGDIQAVVKQATTEISKTGSSHAGSI